MSKEVDNCEPNSIECYRFVPKVSYDWYDPNSPNPNLKRFAAFYKLDYGSDTGLARIRDADTFGSSLINNIGDQPMIINEVAFLAVKDGQPRDYDNIHTAHSNQGIFIPGCKYFSEFDCVHMHWRWGESKIPVRIDPMVEPSTGEPLSGVSPGTPNLVPGQTIAIAIVKDNPGEEDPDDIFTLLNPPEQIATARAAGTGKLTPGMPDIELCKNCVLTKGGDPIVWYVASVSDKNKDTFFRHGFFVLDTNPGDPRTTGRNQIRGSLQNGENVQSELKGVDEASDSMSSPTESSPSISTSSPTNSLPIASSLTVSINGNTPVELCQQCLKTICELFLLLTPCLNLIVKFDYKRFFSDAYLAVLYLT